MIAPTKVIGMERRRPITDAAYALTMSSVSAEADRVRVGATRIPANAASMEPMIQALRAFVLALDPLSEVSVRSSTLARMVTPIRVR